LRTGPRRGSLLIGVSGRIAAGKTTIARMLERRGFAYSRFSLVIDDEIRSRSGVPERAERQRVGYELHETKGQRWLCERVLEQVPSAPFIVVDGLRWQEDAIFFFERFGSQFLHLHVEAPAHLRSERYSRDANGGPAFGVADAQPVESQVDALGRLATKRIINDSSLEALERKLLTVIGATADA
jgi:dephospho-CoA kinase